MRMTVPQVASTARHQRAFTLLELMVVVAILGILVSVALPAYGDYVGRAQLAEAMSLASELKPIIKEYHKERGRFPGDNMEAGVPEPNLLIGNFVTGMELADGAIHVHLGNNVHSELMGKWLTLRPAVVEGSPASPFSWLCGNRNPVEGMRAIGENKTDIPPAFLPSSCR